MENKNTNNIENTNEVEATETKKHFNWKKFLKIGAIVLGGLGTFVLGVFSGSIAEKNRQNNDTTQAPAPMPATQEDPAPEAAPAEQ